MKFINSIIIFIKYLNSLHKSPHAIIPPKKIDDFPILNSLIIPPYIKFNESKMLNLLQKLSSDRTSNDKILLSKKTIFQI